MISLAQNIHVNDYRRQQTELRSYMKKPAIVYLYAEPVFSVGRADRYVFFYYLVIKISVLVKGGWLSYNGNR